MKRSLFCTLFTGLFLASCGVDGPPTTPEPKKKTGVTMTGTVETGVRGSF